MVGGGLGVTAQTRRRALVTMAQEAAVLNVRKCSRPPVSRVSARSRMTTTSSASAGMPAIPSRADHIPSFRCPPAASERLLAVLGDDHVEPGGVLQRPTQQACVGHTHPIVAEEPYPERSQFRHRAEPLACGPP